MTCKKDDQILISWGLDFILCVYMDNENKGKRVWGVSYPHLMIDIFVKNKRVYIKTSVSMCSEN